MTTATMQIFILLDEYKSYLDELTKLLNVNIVLFRNKANNQCFLENAKNADNLIMNDGKIARDVYLSEEKYNREIHNANNIFPNKWGWFHYGMPPSIVEDSLFLVQMGAKSDWYDSEKKAFFENPVSIELSKKIFHFLSNKLNKPILARNIIIPSSEYEICKGLFYSDGAKEWFEKGGKLRQFGVKNIEFIIGK